VQGRCLNHPGRRGPRFEPQPAFQKGATISAWRHPLKYGPGATRQGSGVSPPTCPARAFYIGTAPRRRGGPRPRGFFFFRALLVGQGRGPRASGPSGPDRRRRVDRACRRLSSPLRTNVGAPPGGAQGGISGCGERRRPFFSCAGSRQGRTSSRDHVAACVPGGGLAARSVDERTRRAPLEIGRRCVASQAHHLRVRRPQKEAGAAAAAAFVRPPRLVRAHGAVGREQATLNIRASPFLGYAGRA